MRKVKNSIKKMMALCLAAIMTLAMATTAFAADRIKTGNLTVNVNEGNTLKGQTIKVYKLFDLSVSDTHYAYTVNADYKNAIATALGLSKEATSEQLYNKLAEYKENPSGIQKFANDFTAAALKAGTAETGTSGKITSAEKSYTFNNLAFRLYRSEEDANNNQNAIAVTGSNGTYTVDPVQVGDNKMYDMESIGDGTTVGTGMNLKLNGLAEGSYWLVETQAPDGYNKLTAPVKITITKSDTTNVDDWTIKQNDGVVDDKIIDIENTTGTLLPETGGMGTVIFTVIAVVMILGIAVSFVISRRKRA